VKFELHHNSLFAALLRSSWWISAALSAGIFAATKLFLPTEFAVFAASPFIVISLYVAWKQLRAPSAGRIAKRPDANSRDWHGVAPNACALRALLAAPARGTRLGAAGRAFAHAEHHETRVIPRLAAWYTSLVGMS